MRRLSFLPLLLTLTIALSTVSSTAAAESEASVGAVLGYNLDLEYPLAGIDARYAHPVAPMVDVSVQFQANYYFTDSVQILGATSRSTLLQFDLNLLASIDLSLISPYVGVGPALLHNRTRVTSGDTEISSSTSTDTGLNVVAGAALKLDGPIRPFAQFRSTFRDGSAASIMLGVNFVLN